MVKEDAEPPRFTAINEDSDGEEEEEKEQEEER